MIEQHVEVSSIDLRYQECRIKNFNNEKHLLQGILENGIQDPLQGVGKGDSKILLNGFKRLRCAKKLGINVVPYCSLSDDEAIGILQLLRITQTQSLTILEQAKLIAELKSVYGLCNADIARSLEKSKGWVSMRTGLLEQMSSYAIKKIMSGSFPAYSYMYTLRPFMRMNTFSGHEMDGFIKSVSGKALSTRNIEILAHAYFKGSPEMRQQIENGQTSWALDRLKQTEPDLPDCSVIERNLLQDFTLIKKYMVRIIADNSEEGDNSNSFYAQCNLLTGEILKNSDTFSKKVKDFYDRSRQT
jgi:hypothetical protein